MALESGIPRRIAARAWSPSRPWLEGDRVELGGKPPTLLVVAVTAPDEFGVQVLTVEPWKP